MRLSSFWCRWRGSNPHGVTTNGFWVHLVCQFQHTGVCNGHYIIGYRTYSRKSSIFSHGHSFTFKTLCAFSTKAYFVVKMGWGTRPTHHLIVTGILHAFWAIRRRHVFEKFTIDFSKYHLLIYTSTPRGVLKLICLRALRWTLKIKHQWTKRTLEISFEVSKNFFQNLETQWQ